MRTGGAQLIIPGIEVVQAGGGDTPWWLAAGVTPVAAYAAKGAASLAASYVNLANVGVNDAAPGVAPTWDAVNGWTFNGSTQYLTTGIVHASGWSMLVRYTDAGAGTFALAGAFTAGTNELSILPRYALGLYYANGGSLIVAPGLAAGVMAVAGNKAYRNGVAEAGTLGAYSGTNTRALAIGAENNNGTIARFLSCKIQAVWIAASTLDAAQVLAMYTAMAAL